VLKGVHELVFGKNKYNSMHGAKVKMVKAVFKGAWISLNFELKPYNFKCDFFSTEYLNVIVVTIL
jgi:hypothetical protein